MFQNFTSGQLSVIIIFLFALFVYLLKFVFVYYATKYNDMQEKQHNDIARTLAEHTVVLTQIQETLIRNSVIFDEYKKTDKKDKKESFTRIRILEGAVRSCENFKPNKMNI